MKIIQTTWILLLLQPMLLALAGHASSDDEVGKISIGFNSNSLPAPRSDMTATTLNDMIYIIGGCDNPDGNIKATGWDGYYCPSVTNVNVMYNPERDTFTILPAAPRVRYRHAAVALDDHIWLIGGRDAMDDVVTQVDVFNPFTQSWSTPGSLANVTSDLAAFASLDTTENTMIYLVGGWVADYSEASKAFTMFDTANLDTTDDSDNSAIAIPVESNADLLTARGDTHVAVYNNGAFVSGGFNHLECSALSSVEYYDMSSKTWTEVDGLIQGRGDKALVEMNGYLFAVGGEDTDGCGGSSLALDDVEVFAAKDGTPLTTEWQDLGSIPRNTFRFVAAAYPAENKIFTFGGQEALDEDCDCYRTSKLVTVYTWDDGRHDHSSGGSKSVVGSMLVSCVVGVAVMMVTMM